MNIEDRGGTYFRKMIRTRESRCRVGGGQYLFREDRSAFSKAYEKTSSYFGSLAEGKGVGGNKKKYQLCELFLARSPADERFVGRGGGGGVGRGKWRTMNIIIE